MDEPTTFLPGLIVYVCMYVGMYVFLFCCSHHFLDEFLGLDSSTAMGVVLHNKSAPAGQVSSGQSDGASKMSFFGRRKK